MNMSILLISVLSVSILSCIGSATESNGVANNVINAGDYELEFDDVFQKYWKHNRTITDDLRNVLAKLNKPNLKIEEVSDCLAPRRCLKCRAFAFTFINYYRNHSEENIDEYLFDLCTILAKGEDYDCHGKIDIYGPSIKYILKHRANELIPDQVCGILMQHSECSTNKNWIDFTIKSDREPVLKASKEYSFDEKSMNSSSFFTIAHLSDFHYDPHYAAGSSSDCIDFICCRNTSIPKDNSTHKAGYWGDYHSCDSPGYLVENICSHVAANHKNIDLIYYTGDFADHFSWLTTKASIKHSIEFITQQIKANFPNVPVTMVIGNHDIHPSDAFAPDSTGDLVNSKWLYEFAAEQWSEWLPESALSTLRIGGYYSYVFRPGYRIIVLNNNLCFEFNIWLVYGSKEMVEQLEWLRDTLILAEKNGERVHILGHVPPNTSSCIRAWNREYNKLIRQFTHIISGQFNGHTHTDEFTMFYSTDNEPVALSVAWNGGSGTTFIGLNSNYRLYTAEWNTFEVVDHETYIFNLTEANLMPDQPPNWFKEYSFRDAFAVTDLSPSTLAKLVNETFRNDRSLLHKLWTFKEKFADPKMAKGCDDACLDKLRLLTNGDIENNFFD